MNSELIATWAILFGFGLLIQVLATKVYTTRIPNRSAAILSALLLAGSLIVVWPALGNKGVVFFTVVTCYLLFNAYVLTRWQFHPLRTLQQVRSSAIRFAIVALLALAIGSFGALRELYVAELVFVLSLYAFAKVVLIIESSSITRSELNGKVPTVTFATPARNETHALTKHMRSAVATEYPKIEFLVLDDCSQDDTAQIIRSFAHDGARFIKGEEPIESWVGKNQAYKTLASEASGEYIVFAGVDTRYEPETISRLIAHMKSNKNEMISIMPWHENSGFAGSIIQPMRYLFMMLTSTKKRPPILSTVWVIKASALKRLGGIDAVSKSIIPETYFARELARKHAYQFIIAPRWLGLTTRKKPSSQSETARRTLYPLLHKSVFSQFTFFMSLFLLWLYPLYAIVSAVLSDITGSTILFMVSLVLLSAAYLAVLLSSYSARTALFSPVMLPLGLGIFYYLSLKSMFQYEHDEIIWKGRNVCSPVMLTSVEK